MEFFIISMLNGLSYGLLLFMLSSGLTLIFSMMGVLNFAHASFYMVGAYVGYTVSRLVGFWPALVIAPLVVGALGAVFERLCLRRVHKFGHVPELLITFGLSYVILELVQLIWGRIARGVSAARAAAGPGLHADQPFGQRSEHGLGRCACRDVQRRRCGGARGLFAVPGHPRLHDAGGAGHAGVGVAAAHTHPHRSGDPGGTDPSRGGGVLGHNVPAVFMLVFGAGAALAGLAGVIGGSTFLTEPSMAATVGSVIFVVVVVGGMGSLSGAFLASVLIGVIQTFAVAFDYSVGSLAAQMGVQLSPGAQGNTLVKLTISQVAPILPYLFLVLILIFRPKGLLGTREG
jgi:branched-chain amino acid transport system permease protein